MESNWRKVKSNGRSLDCKERGWEAKDIWRWEISSHRPPSKCVEGSVKCVTYSFLLPFSTTGIHSEPDFIYFLTIFTCSPANWSGLKSRAEQREAKSKSLVKSKWVWKQISLSMWLFGFKMLYPIVCIGHTYCKYWSQKKGTKGRERQLYCMLIHGFELFVRKGTTEKPCSWKKGTKVKINFACSIPIFLVSEVC